MQGALGLHDRLYEKVMAWVSAQRMTEISRDIKASSSRSRGGINESDHEITEAGYFNYKKLAGSRRVYFEPNNGNDTFVHGGNDTFVYDGRCFLFSKGVTDKKYKNRIEQFVVIRCQGRSTQPIKDWITRVKDWTSDSANNMTDIWRAKKGDGNAIWDYQLERRLRLMETVSLEEEQKQLILADINEYLQPATANWFVVSHIPLIRIRADKLQVF